MDDDVDELLVSVRADTRAFAADMAVMKQGIDTQLLDGLGKAGDVLERGLLGAIRRGSLGFDELKAVALDALEAIAAQALQLGLDAILGGQSGGGQGAGGLGNLGLVGQLLGLPGRATGGLVGPDRPYLVGERGPEIFVPDSAGRIDPNRGGAARTDVRVAINLATPRGTPAPVALQRSTRQIASALRRVLG